jgi:hypothetical protein
MLGRSFGRLVTFQHRRSVEAARAELERSVAGEAWRSKPISRAKVLARYPKRVTSSSGSGR